MSDGIYNVLFLCTGNSARSILAESVLTTLEAGRFRAFSAGSQPKGSSHPIALEVLRSFDFRSEGSRSKSWAEFSEPNALRYLRGRVDLLVSLSKESLNEITIGARLREIGRQEGPSPGAAA